MSVITTENNNLLPVLVTGSAGFIGRNLCAALKRRGDIRLLEFDLVRSRKVLAEYLSAAKIVFHLAGVNRPHNDDEFRIGNADFTSEICNILLEGTNRPAIVFSSSIQADLDNAYGASKKQAEEVLDDYRRRTGSSVTVYRLPNVFGKWSRPNYNSVVSTFCYNIARDLDITISDPARELELVYIDDVVAQFQRHLDEFHDVAGLYGTVSRSFKTTLGQLAENIRSLHAINDSLVVPDLTDELMRCLHATYLSSLPGDGFATSVQLNSDPRGWLFELIKSEHFGQIFVSKTKPGITRGNHYHDTKLEKFCVIQGEGLIRFRRVDVGEIINYPVNDQNIQVVDIPPGYTHSIENTGKEDLICLFWANEIFDHSRPDTYYVPVIT